MPASMDKVKFLYRNPRLSGSLGGVRKFMSERGLKNYKQIKDYLEKLEEYSLFKPTRKTFKRRKYMCYFIDFMWQSDLADLSKYQKENKGYKFLMITIDCFSRYLWLRKLKSKSGKDVAAAFSSIIKSSGRQPLFLHTDEGKEYYNQDVKKILDKYEIQHYSTTTHIKAGLAERAIRTVMGRFAKLWHVHSNHVWFKYIDSIAQSYNSTTHSSIGVKPKDANEDNAGEIFRRLYQKMLEYKTPQDAYTVGDSVRVSENRQTFRKGYLQTYGPRIYIIKSIRHSKPTTFSLVEEDGTPVKGWYYAEELSKVQK